MFFSNTARSTVGETGFCRFSVIIAQNLEEEDDYGLAIGYVHADEVGSSGSGSFKKAEDGVVSDEAGGPGDKYFHGVEASWVWVL